MFSHTYQINHWRHDPKIPSRHYPFLLNVNIFKGFLNQNKIDGMVTIIWVAIYIYIYIKLVEIVEKSKQLSVKMAYNFSQAYRLNHWYCDLKILPDTALLLKDCHLKDF